MKQAMKLRQQQQQQHVIRYQLQLSIDSDGQQQLVDLNYILCVVLLIRMCSCCTADIKRVSLAQPTEFAAEPQEACSLICSMPTSSFHISNSSDHRNNINGINGYPDTAAAVMLPTTSVYHLPLFTPTSQQPRRHTLICNSSMLPHSSVLPHHHSSGVLSAHTLSSSDVLSSRKMADLSARLIEMTTTTAIINNEHDQQRCDRAFESLQEDTASLTPREFSMMSPQQRARALAVMTSLPPSRLSQPSTPTHASTAATASGSATPNPLLNSLRSLRHRMLVRDMTRSTASAPSTDSSSSSSNSADSSPQMVTKSMLSDSDRQARWDINSGGHVLSLPQSVSISSNLSNHHNNKM